MAPSDQLTTKTGAAGEHFERALRLVRQARLSPTSDDRRSIFVAAASEFERVLEYDPMYPGARTNLGYCFIELGRYGEAKSETERVLEEFPQDISAYINYAVILQHNHRTEEAEAHLRRAMTLDPQQGTVYRDLAYLLERQRQFRRAADNLERYLEFTPHANDERQVRQRIKLLRQRAGFFELPDRSLIPEGITSDLRWRAVGVLLDGMIWAALWILAGWLSRRIQWLEFLELPAFGSLVYLYHIIGLEIWGRSLGKMAANLRVRNEREASWFAPMAIRETLRLGPILMSLLLPFPWNLVSVGLFVILAGLSALRDRQGCAWYDRLTKTYIVEEDAGFGRIIAGITCLLSLVGALFWWAR